LDDVSWFAQFVFDKTCPLTGAKNTRPLTGQAPYSDSLMTTQIQLRHNVERESVGHADDLKRLMTT